MFFTRRRANFTGPDSFGHPLPSKATTSATGPTLVARRVVLCVNDEDNGLFKVGRRGWGPLWRHYALFAPSKYSEDKTAPTTRMAELSIISSSSIKTSGSFSTIRTQQIQGFQSGSNLQ